MPVSVARRGNEFRWRLKQVAATNDFLWRSPRPHVRNDRNPKETLGASTAGSRREATDADGHASVFRYVDKKGRIKACPGDALSPPRLSLLPTV